MFDLDDTPEMHDEYRRLYEDYLRHGWKPHTEPRGYTCGWCGQSVTSQVGLFKIDTRYPLLGMGPTNAPSRFTRDIRICNECAGATTFENEDQYPAPKLGERFDARQKSSDVQLVVTLYDEARMAVSQGAPSCGVLMFRKLLMHIAVEQGLAEKRPSFEQCCDYLRSRGIVGTPQHGLLDRIRVRGNAENHQIVRATIAEAQDLLSLTSLLVRSVYFLT